MFKQVHDDTVVTHCAAQLGAEHLLVLAVLALQAVHVALDLEDVVGGGGLAGGEEAAPV